MDLDVYVFEHRPGWDRLRTLTGRRRLTGAEADEFVARYRQASADLAHIQATAPDPDIVSGLATLVAQARIRALRKQADGWQRAAHFVTDRLPAALYRAWPWWVAMAVTSVLAATAVAVWVRTDRRLLPTKHQSLTKPGGAFESYYTENPPATFFAQVWTHNATIAVVALFLGVLIVPALYVLWNNVENLGMAAALMSDAGRLDSFFTHILPHGMIELTSVFIAGGVGLRLGWTAIDPGPRSRAAALAQRGHDAAVIAVGLVVMLFTAGLLEGFVTPSTLPAAVEIGIGGLVEAAFLAYVFIVGRRAATRGGCFDTF